MCERLSGLAQFEDRTVAKVYWAAVEGDVQPDEGTWTDHLHKRHGMPQSIVVPPDDPRGKLAVMRYRVLSRGHIAEPSLLGMSPPGQVAKGDSLRRDGRAMYSWLEVELETGRTHQIRVQAASRGHAVIGDAQYGSLLAFAEQFKDERLRAIALHARQLGFSHPMTGEPVEVVAPLLPAWGIFDSGARFESAQSECPC